MKSKILNTLKYLSFLAVGLGLMYWLYDKNKDQMIFEELKFNKEVNLKHQGVLTWVDSSATQFKFFTIERSSDSISYVVSDTIKISRDSIYTYFDEKTSSIPGEKLLYKIKAWSQIDLVGEIKNMDLKWYIVAFIFSLISNWSRAVRWQTIIEPLGYKPKTMNTFLSVNIMYFSNLIVPRSGEITRCSILYQYEKIPVAKLIGTVLIERVIDILFLLLLTGAMIVSQFDFIKTYISKPDVQKSLAEKAELWPLLVAVILSGILMVVLLYVFRKRIVSTKLGKKIGKLLGDLWEGMKSTKNIERKWSFIFHSFLIWTLYFGVLYVSFLSYGPTYHLGMGVAFVALITGSFAMVAPSVGGIGTWHAMIIFTLVIFGVHEPQAFIYTFAAFFMMTITNIVAGGLSFIFLPMYNGKRKLTIKEK